jgi:hypothetical protein
MMRVKKFYSLNEKIREAIFRSKTIEANDAEVILKEPFSSRKKKYKLLKIQYKRKSF